MDQKIRTSFGYCNSNYPYCLSVLCLLVCLSVCLSVCVIADVCRQLQERVVRFWRNLGCLWSTCEKCKISPNDLIPIKLIKTAILGYSPTLCRSHFLQLKQIRKSASIIRTSTLTIFARKFSLSGQTYLDGDKFERGGGRGLSCRAPFIASRIAQLDHISQYQLKHSQLHWNRQRLLAKVISTDNSLTHGTQCMQRPLWS